MLNSARRMTLNIIIDICKSDILIAILYSYLFCRFDMELHAVHQNTKGEIAVIGIWYKIGDPDSLLSKVY
jgi:hypothetical protein